MRFSSSPLLINCLCSTTDVNLATISSTLAGWMTTAQRGKKELSSDVLNITNSTIIMVSCLNKYVARREQAYHPQRTKGMVVGKHRRLVLWSGPSCGV